MQEQRIARPKKNGMLLINDGNHGSISLHPNQKWEAIVNDSDKKVYISRDCVTLILDNQMFDECFYMTRPERK